jgi:hypothetical protein
MSDFCLTAKRLAAEEVAKRDRFKAFRQLVERASAAELRKWLHAVAAMYPGVAREVGRELFYGPKAGKR